MTPNSYTVIHLNKENYKDYLPLGEIAAFMWADPGAQGECGALHIMTTDLRLYKTNYMYGEIPSDALYELCPPLKDSTLYQMPQWKITSLGMGNYLIINRNIADLFNDYGKKYNKFTGELYQNWADIVFHIIKHPDNLELMRNADNALSRFIKAYEYYLTALNEIRNGKKTTHWIWYIFPQLRGFGHSYNSTFYGIESFAEARAFLDNQYLGNHLREITETLLTLDKRNIRDIFGEIDAMKVRSSMTLFDLVCPNDIFAQVLDKYYDGKRCELTIERIKRENNK